jgi:hypothetical protein
LSFSISLNVTTCRLGLFHASSRTNIICSSCQHPFQIIKSTLFDSHCQLMKSLISHPFCYVDLPHVQQMNHTIRRIKGLGSFMVKVSKKTSMDNFTCLLTCLFLAHATCTLNYKF